MVPFAWTAKPVLEQVVGLKLGEHPGPLPATISQDSGYRERGVVVEDALRHSAQEREGGDVSVAEGLRRLGGIRLHIAPVAVREVQGEVVGFAFHSADDHSSFAVVALGMSRRVGQR